MKDEFNQRVQRIVWCTFTTVDGGGRPRSRILHPVWEGATGWIMTGRHSYKDRHLSRNPYVSLTYWDPQHQQVYAECRAEWADAPAEKARIWKLFATTPEPYGYNPAMFWKSPDDPNFGALKLTPWRLELSALGDMASGKPPRVWRPK
ncbi:MAG: pyridoxamine 5'-phosphate oxidase family protein [Chloroflexi bacterium]|nr:pyridoxamine 5'-phosphate oxidase family protein [Chloroflexota bacterium]